MFILASLIKTFLVKTAFASYYLKLCLPMFLKCFSIFAYFQSHVSYINVSYKKTTCTKVLSATTV